ncbi:MAG: hypothetical protein IJW45_00605 [Oscillospiraceae bacterium]|nr:hypothetical protein [Oscillospiraceae bacterium]
MSEILRDIGKAAQRVVTRVGEEVSCAALEQRIQDAYRDLGRAYHDTVARGEEPTAEMLQVHMDKIDRLRQELEQKRQK